MKPEFIRPASRFAVIALVVSATVALCMLPLLELGRSFEREDRLSPYATTLKAEALAISGSGTFGGSITVASCSGCGGGGGGSGTVTSVGSGSGISGGPITGSGSLAIDPTYTQRRVSGTCTSPNAIAVVAQDGTVTCTTGVSTLTNSAAANAVMKSNGTNAVASSMVDDTFSVTATVPYVTSNMVESYSGAAYLDNGFLNFGYNTNAAATGYINRVGYHQGTSQFRNLEIDDGRGASMFLITGSAQTMDLPTASFSLNTSRVFLSSTAPSYFRADNPNTSNEGYVGFGGNASTSHGSPIDIQSNYTGLTTPSMGAGSTANTMLNMFTADFFNTAASAAKIYGLHINRGGDIGSGTGGMTIVGIDSVPGSATASYLVSLQTEDFPGQSIGTVEWHAGHVHRHTGLPMANPSCGTSGTVSGDDVQGAETVGTGTVTSCALTFREPWKQEVETGTCPSTSTCVITVSSVVPNCTVTSRSGTVVLSYSISATVLTVTAASLTGATFDWHCEAPN